MKYTLKDDGPLLLFKFKKFSSYIKIYTFVCILNKTKVHRFVFFNFHPFVCHFDFSGLQINC